MKTCTIVVREINIDWRRLMTSSFEDFTKKAEAFLEEHITEYLSVDMALEDFARQYNQGLFDEITSPDSKQERAWKLIEEAYHYYEDDPSRSQEFLTEALKLDPENLDAKQMLLTFQSPLEHLKGLIALEKEQRSKWEQGPKMGWANLDERPYLSLKYNLAKFYLSNSMNRFAIKEFEEILEIDVQDHMGVRYELMATYCNLEEFDKAKSFFECEQMEYHEEDLMIVPMMTVSLMTGHIEDADFYFELLYAKNPEFENYLKMIEQGDEERLVAETLKVNPILFEANSMQSLLMVFNQVVDLSQSEYYFTWLIEKYRAKRPQRHVAKKKNPELHKLIRELEKSIEPSKALQGLSISVERILRQHGLIEFKDFKKKTEEEVAAIRGVGKVSMQILKENGVVFKKKWKKK